MPKSMDEVQGLSILINSCQLWKENGPLIQLVQETIDQLNQQAGIIPDYGIKTNQNTN